LKIKFVTNFCAHYRVKTFETLSNYYDVDFLFFSKGNEWYWQEEHGTYEGNFNFRYLNGFSLGGTRINPSLIWELLRGDYNVIIKCINGRFALPITFLISKFRRKPFILWTGIWMRLQTPAHKLFYPITQHIYRNSSAVVVYGKHVKDFLIGEGVPEERIFIAAHAVENNDYNSVLDLEMKVKFREDLNISANTKIVLYVGRLENGKGLEYLLEGFKLVNNNKIKLIFVGKGSLLDELKFRAKLEGIIEDILFAGYVSPKETVYYYSIADVLILPSITTATTKETWGLVINEAFNQGVPVIATDAVGAAAGGLVKDGINGYIIPEKDSRALSVALEKILNNPELRKDMSSNAKSIIKDWNNEMMVLGFRRAIEYVLTK
jgi:glycosyltransferase involved in cell wall biosynthesis